MYYHKVNKKDKVSCSCMLILVVINLVLGAIGIIFSSIFDSISYVTNLICFSVQFLNFFFFLLFYTNCVRQGFHLTKVFQLIVGIGCTLLIPVSPILFGIQATQVCSPDNLNCMRTELALIVVFIIPIFINLVFMVISQFYVAKDVIKKYESQYVGNDNISE